MSFDGIDYFAEHDENRLTKQIDRIFQLMRDREWRTLAEIEAVTGDSSASISAQLRNLRKERFGSHTINRRRRGDRAAGLYEYQLEPKQIDLLLSAVEQMTIEGLTT